MFKNNSKINYKTAQNDDINAIVNLMQEYYDYEGIKLDKQIACVRLKEFIEKSEAGKIWLILIDDDIAGYIVVVNGFGLEHGRNVMIDEFYIREEYRGFGIGHKTIKYIENEIRSIGIVSIHTEVKRRNTKAQLFWENLGFQKYDRFPMTKMI